ncbi:MAG TPA: dihydropteroate synthase [Solirubrobacteraceae bacterium]
MAPSFQVMGIINVTPDSFSDGGLFLDRDAAVAHGLQLVAQGADILDIGGESTRPGSEPVSLEQELERVIGVVDALGAALEAPRISIDTRKAAVARAALTAGASLVNDVSALRSDPAMAGVIASAGAECCLMHMQGEPRTMQADPRYSDVVDDVKAFLEERLRHAVESGIDEQRIMLDPGIGFGKTVAQNLELLRRLDELCALGRPILIGPSRKSFIARTLAEAAPHASQPPPEERLAGTIATCVIALERGARVFRVHDVTPVRDALAVAAATLSA